MSRSPLTDMVHKVIDALVHYDASGDHIDNVAHGAKEPHARAECDRCRIEDALPGWGKGVLARRKKEVQWSVDYANPKAIPPRTLAASAAYTA